MRKYINTSIKDFISENVQRNDRDVILVDEHGKNIVYDNGNYRIAVDNPQSARYITLWYKKDENKWVKVGVLDASITYRRFGKYDGDFLSIRSIEIDKKHRKLGLSTLMYKALIDFSDKNIIGIFSYLPDRVNKKEIPNIYSKFDAVTDEDYQYIIFKK